MSIKRITTWAAVATLVWASAFGGSAALAGPLGLIDDFSGDLSAYTLSRVNDANGTSHVSFSVSGGDLRAAYTGTPNAHEQVLLLRDDYTLGVGETLLADVSGDGTGWDRDLGIAVGYTETPPSLADGVSGDVRSSYVEVAYRSNNQVVSFARNGGANLASGQEFSGTMYNGESFTGYVDSLFIKRLTTNTFEVGWIDGGIRHVVTNNGSDLGGVGIPYYTITDANVPGAAVGIYADARAAIAASPSALDNLRIAVPEPVSWLLAVVGLMGAAPLRKRATR